MALSVEKLLADAHTLIIHLKDHDSLADNIIATTQTLYNKVEAMKQYQDDITELNEIAKHRPRSTLVLGIAQENRQIRELQQENRELQATLEEHQSALELIMQKYREHTVKLLQSNRLEKAIQDKEVLDKDSMSQLMDKIDEMAGVMQQAIEVDETVGCADKERLSRLEVENRALRELLEICTTSKDKIVQPGLEKEEKKEEDEEDDDDDKTDTESDTTILEVPTCAAKKGKEEEKETDAKKKKKPSEPGSKESTPTATGSRTAGASKSSTDLRKGRVTPTGKTDAVKKTSSTTGIKKDVGTMKKSTAADTKKEQEGAARKSPHTTDTKKDLKAKVTPKTTGKK